MVNAARAIRYGVLAWAVLGALLATAEESPRAPWRLAQASLPTLDDAIRIYSHVDRDEVFLGESVTLTLEYWELSYRGVKVQPYYRTGGVELPQTEGFYAGQLRDDRHDATRDGALYHVIAYRQELYPTKAGMLTIGAWQWKGTVRGHTSSGAQTVSVDTATDPVEVRVRPLPDPPSTFRGAVGEYEIALELAPRTLNQGVPAALAVELTGTGNPQTLEAPPMPDGKWFNLSGPVESVVAGGGDGGTFTKRFQFDLLPLSGGTYTFPPISFTYFSPRAEHYKTVRTAAAELEIEAAGEAETLVVIGGGSGGGAGLIVMDEGRLPLVSEMGAIHRRRGRPGQWPVFIALPPLLYAVTYLLRHGFRSVLFRPHWPRRGTPLDVRLAAAGRHPRPVDALNAVAREYLGERLGRAVDGMTIPEIEVCLAGSAPPAVAEAVVAVLRVCQDCRYGKRNRESVDLAGLIARAGEGLARIGPPRRGGGQAR